MKVRRIEIHMAKRKREFLEIRSNQRFDAVQVNIFVQHGLEARDDVRFNDL